MVLLLKSNETVHELWVGSIDGSTGNRNKLIPDAIFYDPASTWGQPIYHSRVENAPGAVQGLGLPNMALEKLAESLSWLQ